jgi:hypothetical protein
MAERIIGLRQLEARLTALRSPILGEKVMRTLALTTVREAKLAVPRRTGNLGRSIHVAAIGPVSARVVAGANYAAFVEFGTRAHEITPNAKRALRWAATSAGARLTGTPRKAAQRGALGGVVFATRVHHPGTRPQPFLLKGARAAILTGHLDSAVVAVWNAAA